MADAAELASGPLHEPYDTYARQHEAALLGMWAFLASEILLFSGLFMVYAAHRWTDGAAFTDAARHTNLAIGTLNAVLLLTSSAVLTTAGRAQLAGRRTLTVVCVGATLALGVAFLAAKGVEYAEDLREHLWPSPDFSLPQPASRLFFALYWISTGLHAVHVTVGLLLIGRLAWMARAGVLMRRPESMEATSLYWHVVDAVWMVLYPCLYLVGR